MKIKDILHRLKANRYTYYNLDNNTIQNFKKLYSYLKRNKDKEISKNVFQNTDALQGQINYWLSLENELDYLKKYKSMELIANNIKH